MLIGKFLDPEIDLSPAGIDNHAMGTGGMLTVAEETLQGLAKKQNKRVATYLYGQEINPETYAICKADILLKGEGENADHIVGGAEHSTLSHDAFPAQEFNFMLANPPYGKSWKKDLEQMGGKEAMCDPRFKVMHNGEELSLVTRSGDGQLLLLENMAAKMNHKSKLGSRIAEVHNGSSLFTGDAGQGESNIRRWLIENDWLEAIVALPLNLFYNTGIATHNRLSEEEAGIIATRLVRRVQAKTTLPPEKTEALQRALTETLRKRFTDDKAKLKQNALLKSVDGLQQVGGEYLDKVQIPVLKEAIARGLRSLPDEK